MGEKIIKVLTAIIAIGTLSGCQIANGQTSSKKTDKVVGFWEHKADSVWKYIYEFRTNIDQTLYGIVHSYYYGIKDNETRIERIKMLFPEVILKFGAPSNMEQVFIIDTLKNTMVSEMELPDQSKIKMVYHKLSSSQLNGVFPRKSHLSVYSPPALLNDGISVKDLSENKNITQSIDSAISQIINKDYGIIFSLLISHKNQLIVEEYFYDHDVNTLENQSSATKSIVALLTMAAIDDHYINGLDDNINTYLDFNPSQAITIQNLLSMKAGMKLDEEEAWRYSDDRLSTLLNREIISKPGTVLSYDNGIPNILNAIIFNATSKQADRYAADRIFKKIGITEYNWEIDKQNGFPDGSGTLQLSSRDMLKIGLLVLNKGKWDGKTVVEEESIKKLSERHTWIDEYKMGYGLLWWIKEIEVNNKQYEVIYASGSGGRFIIVIPELQIAAVLTGGNYDMSEHYKSWGLLKQPILQIIKN
ncbi:MAG TPA: serine hydrolase [Tenuifilaceae bacterium]|nr:serine hydrolase [Tenuifilaceae bacterium]HPJ45555.1 serine hydrolase [Tenuifilaceae bacterium]HPQ35780.1 serine hydrolase [Tenuifilaceae bacterium]HRX68459.1 serine hydrolase [Tenuifilaceae bacterium]